MNQVFLRIFSMGLLFLLASLPQSLLATHIVGGEMNYRCLGNDQYEVSLTVFRDCDTGVPWFDNPAAFGVFDGLTNTYLFQQLVSLDNASNDTLEIYLPDSCLVVPNNVCIHTTTYIDTLTLPYNPNGYIVAYQRCCRNQDIVNIVDPSNAGATYWTRITEAALQGCNNSAVFNEFPRVYLCSGVPISFDHSAIDIDGDSIVYEICTPSDGATVNGNPMPQPPNAPPYDTITWLAPYNLADVFGNPSDPLRIDPQTGLLEGTPLNLGVFLVGICLKEYRNGQLISVTRRDFQHVVGTCQRQTISSFDTTGLQCNVGLVFPFTNTSQVVTGTYNWLFDNLGSSTVVHPTFTFPDTGLYTITLVAGIGSPCIDTFSVDMDVNIEAMDISVAAPSAVCAGDSFLITVQDAYEGYSDSANYVWFPDSVILSGQGTDSIWVILNQSTQFSVTGTNSYNCSDATNFNINVQEITAAFDTVTTPCNTTLVVQFQNQSTSNPPVNNFQWQFGSFGTSTAAHPFFVFPDTGIHTVTLIAGVGTACPDTASVDVLIRLTAMELSPIPSVTACVGDSVWVKVNDIYEDYSSSATFTWTPNSAIAAGQGTDSVLVIATTSTQIQVSSINNFGCPGNADFNLDVLQIDADFDTIDLACNISLNIPFVNGSSSNLATLNYLWDFDGLSTSSATDPTFMFPDTGYYSVSLVAGVGTLCPDTTIWDLYLPLYGVDLVDIPPRDVCVGDSVWLVVEDLLENYSDSIHYVWSPASAIVAGQGTDSVLIIPTTAQTIRVWAQNDHLCEDSILTSITVRSVNAAFDTIDLRCNISLNLPFVNTSSSNPSVGAYAWDFGGLGTSSSTNPTYVFPDTGTYTVSLIADAGGPCPDTFDMEVFLPLHGLDMDANDVSIICKTDTVELIVSNSLDAYTDWVDYQWHPMSEIIAGQGNDTAYALMDTNTTFMVTGFNSHGCRDTAFSDGTIIYISPTLSISASPDSIFVGQAAQLWATNDINYIYEWEQDTTLSDWFIYNPEAKPRQTTTYVLRATNQYGCWTMDSIPVYIKEPICGLPVVFLPNAFSPDGDGYNDVLMINGNNITEVELFIYNRWGEKVFETKDQNYGWDGTYKGKACPPDVFGYYMRCVCDDGGTLITKGNITLLR